MKLFEKVKNMFTEEVEEEVKVEKVPTKVKKENIPDVVDSFDEVKIEKEEIKKPVFFTDHDFEDLEPKTKPKKDKEEKNQRNYQDERDYRDELDYRDKREYKETREEFSTRDSFRDKYRDSKKENYSNIDSNPGIYRGNQTNVYNDPYKEKKEERVFKPTPIISPVYGILDKNYHKEDIVSKKETSYSPVGETSNVSTIDEVRQKAYGTLEDELENTLFGSNSILFNNKTEEAKDNKDDFFNELEIESKPDFKERTTREFKKIQKPNLDEEIIPEFKEKNNSFEDEFNNDFDNEEHDKKIRDLEEITMDIGKELNSLLNKKENLKTPEVKKPVKEEIDEDDLFNLIDTMYEGDE